MVAAFHMYATRYLAESCFVPLVPSLLICLHLFLLLFNVQFDLRLLAWSPCFFAWVFFFFIGWSFFVTLHRKWYATLIIFIQYTCFKYNSLQTFITGKCKSVSDFFQIHSREKFFLRKSNTPFSLLPWLFCEPWPEF